MDRRIYDAMRNGLTEEEAAEKLLKEGKNELQSPWEKTAVENFLAQLNDPLIYVLLAAAGISFVLRELADAAIICVVVFVNAFVGMAQEGKARRALEALKKLSSPHAVVVRDGIRKEIAASRLVVGDLVCLEAGCQVPADLRLTGGIGLTIEESALTGENLPVEKRADEDFVRHPERVDHTADEEDIPLGDRRHMAFMSTIVTGGRGEGIVTATGMQTEIGRIASMISETGEELTPLQKRLGDLGKVLSIASLLLCGILFVLAMCQHRNIMEMLLVAISLAVAAVPEGLPAVVTICLALSVTRMVKANTIIRKLPSVETLGAVSVVCSDKTGTLTLNRMTVEQCFEADKGLRPVGGEQAEGGWSEGGESVGSGGRSESGEPSEDLLTGMTLCNDAEAEGRLGDPTELALLDCSAIHGFDKTELELRMPRIGEIAFDSDRKMMTTLHRNIQGRTVSYTKGAPDVVLGRCTRIWTGRGEAPLTPAYRRGVEQAVETMSGEALRVLAVAMCRGAKEPAEERLTFLGLVGMRDPVRPEAVEAVETFRRAGVKTVMITGDHADTALAIADRLGIAHSPEQCMTGAALQRLDDEELTERLRERDITVFARVSPAQKVRIVKGFQESGEIVAMTGDGVNDAPSLKRADIGIAMGRNGTDVARQASDMILTDDNFATIEKAIEEGRGVYENIRKSVIFLLSSNMGEILTMFTAVLLGMASPLKSAHILWVNLITDSLPALALGIDQNDGRSMMEHNPRKPGESLFARGGLACTCFYGILIAAISLLAFLMLPCATLHAMGRSVSLPGIREMLENGGILTRSQTYAFTVLGMSQLFHAVGMRDVNRSVFRMNHRDNKLMPAAAVTGLILQLAVTRVPFLVQAFGTARLSAGEWLMLAGLASFPLIAHECLVLSGKLRIFTDLVQFRVDDLQGVGRRPGLRDRAPVSGDADAR
ncbi:MAG: cation-translocating P-type ATPase [Clostridium sp.]|nr:cation-translocating P-type ATPase [Acetatifactor muris]MCM1527569.1 cation-translocating P-type ATPase [Bacteroides sp.]MCM1563811.1 cation-translocating P-type ATPase [Clostridium sp.]